MNMKKIISAIVLTAGSAVFGHQAMAASTSDSLFLYRFVPTSPVPVDQSLSLMKQFIGETPEVVAPSRDGIIRYVSAKDVNTRFEQNTKTQDVHFHRNFSRYLGDFEPKLPSTEEAIKSGLAFLEKNLLLPAVREELVLAHVGGLRATSTIDGKHAGPVIDKLITLNYSRQVNSLPVIGPGSKIVMDIGENGELIGLLRHWRELSPKATEIGKTELYSTDEAMSLAKQQIVQEFGEGAQFEVLQTKLAYFDNNGRFLQPVYAFETQVFLPDQHIEPFTYVSVIPAMINPPEKLALTKTDPRGLRVIKTGTEVVSDFIPVTNPGKVD